MKSSTNGRGRALYALEGIPLDYSSAILDTNFLIGISHFLYSSKTISNDEKSPKKFFDFFCDYIKKTGRFYVTSNVLEEYRTLYPSEKLIKILIENRLVFSLNGLGLYHELEQKYSSFRGKEGRFDISRTDFDFLISGAVMASLKGKPCGLVSNDLELLASWREFLMMEEDFNSINLGFFTFDLSRENPGVFSRWKK